MRYGDLIQFEPIESVIQLQQADQFHEARELVRTYVVSERLAEVLTDLIIPHLRFDHPYENRGLLIVGNYGTGKSHLMSVLSAVAQWPQMREIIRHPKVARALEAIAGRFQVLRIEIGTTQMPLRDIVLKERLEPFLHRLGIPFSFPALTETSSTKDPLLAAMAAFQERYPEQGLLIVVDELLDYLRGRREQELILDLSFLREVGEVCRLGRFRFIAGLQEALFDSPRFQFAADAVRRVRDRFEQVRITRQDVAYVVAERLLQKTEDQRAWIRTHLQRFTGYYGWMAERLEEFVRLFPVHPTYLEVFERITFAEQRVALKAISQTIRGLLDQEVPSDQPGVISYDSYWPLLAEDPSFRTSPEIREVIEKSQVLSDRIAHAYTRPQYWPLAERLLRALSVLRLTTGDIYAPIGATAEELRDGLALFDPHLPEAGADFLRDTVDTALREIIRTVSGQFVSINPENGQYYLDLKKDIDYDARIEERARTLEAEVLNRYSFDALRELLGQEERTYVSGRRIWQYEVPWPERRVTRPGYLFFGTPNERSTAQPPRDFYLYFLQPFETPPFEDECRPDEIFFRLEEWDEIFEQALRTYAGAREMGLTSSGVHQRVYFEKADRARRELMGWLQTHLEQITVTYQGERRPLPHWEWRWGGIGPDATFRDMVQGIAAACLSPYFEENYPHYPAFTGLRHPITQESRPKMVEEAILSIIGRRTQGGRAVLEGLGLLEDDQVRPEKSPYAHYILERLGEKGPTGVLNRCAIFPAPLKKSGNRGERQARARWLASLAEQVAEDIQPCIAYLREAVSLLPDDHPLSCSFQETQEAILTALRKSDPGEEKAVLDDARRRLDGLKREYREIYLKAHRQARLDGEDDRRKSRLMGDPRWQSLRLLAREIPWLSAKKLDELEARLSGLVSCWRLVEGDLDREPRCPPLPVPPRRPAGRAGQRDTPAHR